MLIMGTYMTKVKRKVEVFSYLNSANLPYTPYILPVTQQEYYCVYVIKVIINVKVPKVLPFNG